MLRKFFLLFLSAFFLFTLLQDKAGAESHDVAPPNTSPAAVVSGDSITIFPEKIDGSTESVKISFGGLTNDSYYVCLSSSEILNEFPCRADPGARNQARKTKKSSSELTAGITVCPASSSTLKIGDKCEDKDYFHEGKIYAVTLYVDEDLTEKGAQTAGFYVNYFYPNVAISGNGGPIQVAISGQRRPLSGKNSDNRNNYQVHITGIDNYGNRYNKQKCTTVKDATTPVSVSFGSVSNDSTAPSPGKYRIEINEQNNEGGIKGAKDSCRGGFTFWQVDVVVKDDGSLDRTIACSETNPDVNDALCNQDPDGSDLAGLRKFLGDIPGITTLNLKCDKARRNANSTYECIEINTAIGRIPTGPLAFISRLFSIVLWLAGAAAILLLIYGGYAYMISRGDPERIKGARETITSAIIGLLFIIFSLVILQVIGADILKIPGFN